MAKVQRMWTTEEELLLVAMAESYPLPHIARRLGRSHGSVRGKLFREGLSSYLTVDRFTTARLAKMLGLDRCTVRYWVENGLLKAQKIKGKKRPTYRIKRKDFVQFYREQLGNPRRWALKRIDPAIVDWLDS